MPDRKRIGLSVDIQVLEAFDVAIGDLGRSIAVQRLMEALIETAHTEGNPS